MNDDTLVLCICWKDVLGEDVQHAGNLMKNQSQTHNPRNHQIQRMIEHHRTTRKVSKHNSTSNVEK